MVAQTVDFPMANSLEQETRLVPVLIYIERMQLWLQNEWPS
jgi:hypothetical protein